METVIHSLPTSSAVVVEEDFFVVPGISCPFRFVISVVPASDGPELRFYQLFHCGSLVFSGLNLSSFLRYVSCLSTYPTVS